MKLAWSDHTVRFGQQVDTVSEQVSKSNQKLYFPGVWRHDGKSSENPLIDACKISTIKNKYSQIRNTLSISPCCAMESRSLSTPRTRSCMSRFQRANAACVTLVRSRLSMQFVRMMPFCSLIGSSLWESRWKYLNIEGLVNPLPV
jgi:superfamily I DNA and RNA helicase